MRKNSLFALIAAIAAMTGMTLSANAQSWNLAGNANANANSKLGTTNAVPLRLTTNNSIRMFINANSGNVAIGNGNSANASYKLYVRGAGFGIYGSGTSYGVVGAGGSYGVYGSGTTAGLYGYSSGTYGTYSSGGTYGVYGSGGSYGVYGTTGGSYGLYGYSSNSSGYGGYGYGGYLGLYGGGGTYGVYGYGGTYGTYGYSSSGYGVIGSSYTGYGAYGSSTDGLGGYFYSTNSYGMRAATVNGYYAGVFDGNVYAFGSYFSSSDKNLKQDIKEFGNAMSIINKLKPRNYQFRNDEKFAALNLPKGTQYGIIAQDLEQVLPSLVHEQKLDLPVKAESVIIKPNSPDGKEVNQLQKTAVAVKTESMNIKGVNYEGLIPIMIKAMQEQNEKIEALTQQVNALTASKQSGTSNASAAIKLPGSYLAQSAPNPAVGTASIRYNNLPAGARAQLFVSDASGKMIKQMQLSSNNGVVNLDVSSLGTGTYTYSLLINGKLIETKTMQVVR